MATLQLNGLTKRFGDLLAVNQLSLQVSTGSIFGLLGPNGAGKTTTMSMIAGLVNPDEGSLQIDGEPFNPTEISGKSRLGVVPQDLALYPDLNAVENLRFFGRLYGLTASALNDAVDCALNRSQLRDVASKPVRTYSGGMKRRLNFATALLHQPEIVILDEPTVGVDPQSRSHLLECVKELSQAGTTVIYASHYMEEIQTICDCVGIMDHGKMLICDELSVLLMKLPSSLQVTTPRLTDQQQQALKARVAQHCRIEHSPSQTLLHFAGTLFDERDQQNENVPTNTNRNPVSLLNQIVVILQELSIEVRGLKTSQSNLEELFLYLTGHSLRD